VQIPITTHSRWGQRLASLFHFGFCYRYRYIFVPARLWARQSINHPGEKKSHVRAASAKYERDHHHCLRPRRNGTLRQCGNHGAGCFGECAGGSRAFQVRPRIDLTNGGAVTRRRWGISNCVRPRGRGAVDYCRWYGRDRGTLAAACGVSCHGVESRKGR
jgi:hypothetical protein